MDRNCGEDLGHGVYVSPTPGDELTVTSPRLDLPWRAAEGQVPGTAVFWHGRSFEVSGEVAVGNGARWSLRSWDGPSAMRHVFDLNREAVQAIADRATTEARGRKARGWTLVLLPVLGSAPAVFQKRWANEWGFAAGRATMVSSIVEMLIGAAGIIQIAASAFGGETFMPTWLAYLGLVLFASGFVRLALVAADDEPVGSLLGTPLLLMAPRRQPTIEQMAPNVRSVTDADGTLELVSPIMRQDWDRDGSLLYRGSRYRLDRVEREGRLWVYFFNRADDDWRGERTLRLGLPRSTRHTTTVSVQSPPSLLRTMLVTAAVTLGPASDQQRWANELGFGAVWLTVLGGAAELLGGIANLQKDLGSAHPWLAMLDFYLVGEGLLRLCSTVVGRPMGSVFGWILRPLYRRHLPANR